MFYISYDISASGLEADFTEEELTKIAASLRAANLKTKDNLTETEKYALKLLEKNSITLPNFFIYTLDNGATVYSFSQLEGNILALPCVVALKNYRSYYQSMANLGNDFKSVAVSKTQTPTVSKIKNYRVEQNKLSFSVSAFFKGTLTVSYTFPEGELTGLIRYIASNIGISNISAVLPVLSSLNISTDENFFSAKELKQTDWGSVEIGRAHV